MNKKSLTNDQLMEVVDQMLAQASIKHPVLFMDEGKQVILTLPAYIIIAGENVGSESGSMKLHNSGIEVQITSWVHGEKEYAYRSLKDCRSIRWVSPAGDETTMNLQTMKLMTRTSLKQKCEQRRMSRSQPVKKLEKPRKVLKKELYDTICRDAITGLDEKARELTGLPKWWKRVTIHERLLRRPNGEKLMESLLEEVKADILPRYPNLERWQVKRVIQICETEYRISVERAMRRMRKKDAMKGRVS